jgi:competence protein ComEC
MECAPDRELLGGDPGAAPGRAARVPPARPLLAVCAALVAGGLWGALRPPPALPTEIALAAVGGAWLGWWGCRAAEGNASTPRTSASLACLLLLGLVSAWRASATVAVDAVGGVDSSAGEGRWTTSWNGLDGARGHLEEDGASGATLDLPAGVAAPGERVRVLDGAEPLELPRGPVPRMAWLPGPRARGHFRIRADELVRVAPSSELPRPWADWRGRLLERCERIEDPTSRGLARAFLLGDGSQLGPGLADLFARNGLRHVLAVSGWHVGWMALLCFGPCAWLLTRSLEHLPRAWRSRRAASALPRVLRVTCVLLYIPLTGNEAPVRRAAIAFALALAADWLPAPRVDGESTGGRARRRRADLLSLWALALILECALDPRAPTRLSLALSYLATLGLMVFTRPMLQLLDRVSGGRLPARAPAGSGRIDGRAPMGIEPVRILRAHCARWLLLGIAASLAAVLATLALVWPSFGEWCPLGVLSTPLLLPLFSWLLLSGTLLLALPCLWPESAFSAPAHALLEILRWIDSLPGTPAPLPLRPLWALWIPIACWALALGLERRSRWRRWALATACVASAVVLAPWTPSPERLEVVALDVGHGTAIAMRAPGPATWIFDCGSRDRARVAQEALAPLLAAWESTAPAVVLSHEDLDHASGLPWLAERYPPWLWAGAVPALWSERLAHTAGRLDLGPGTLFLPASPSGDPPGPIRLVLARGTAPGGSDDSAGGNEGSRTLLVRCGGETLLLCGDAEGAGLSSLLEAGVLDGRCRLLLLPHHGSDTPLLGRLMRAASPSEVWVSCSGPPPVARELDRRGVRWRSTAEGPLALTVPAPPVCVGVP